MKQKQLFSQIAKVAKQQDVAVFVVGGYVRDTLLGRSGITDIDFVVAGSGIAFARAFAALYTEETCRLVEFDMFDTARVLFLHRKEARQHELLMEVEFAGARTEEYTATSRKPRVRPASIEEDLQRRDFTVNAMAQKIGARGTLGKIVDPFHGQQDLKKKELRTPLDPSVTFSDDPLRMLRAARFAAQLSFGIEKQTLRAMEQEANRLGIVSAERVQEEFIKLLATPQPSVGLNILYVTGLMEEFLPEVTKLGGVEEAYGYTHKDNLSHTFAVVDNIAEQSKKPLLRFAGLMHDIAKPQTKKFEKGRGWTFDMHEHLGRKMSRDICNRLRMSKKDREYVAKLVRWHLQPIALMDEGITDSAVRRLIINLKEDLQDLLILCRSDITTGNQKKKQRRLKNYDNLEARIGSVIEKDKLRAFQSPVRGEEIMHVAGLRAGPTVGAIKKELERAILDGEVPNEHDAVLSYFKKICDNYVQRAEDWERIK